MLQKKDISLGSVDEFRELLAAHVKSFTPCEPAAEMKPEAVKEEIRAESAEEVEETEE